MMTALRTNWWRVGVLLLILSGAGAVQAQPLPSWPGPALTMLLPGEPLPSAQRLASGAPGPEYWQQDVSYKIEATLDPEAKRLSGTVTITYANNAPDGLEHLWIQLEQNAFQPESRTAARTGARSRFGGAFADGGYTLREVTLQQGNDTSNPTYRVDGTRMQVMLPEALAPGDTLALTVAYAYTLPERGADRTGWAQVEGGHVFQVAQWYPRPYVYDDTRGWDPLPYLGQGEFYLHYGSFDVRLTLPREYVVSATGALQNPEQVLTDTQRSRLRRARASDRPVAIIAPDEAGTAATRPAGPDVLTWHFQADDVRDVAVGASDVFVWEAARASAQTHDVEVAAFYPPSARGSTQRDGWEAAVRYLQYAVEHHSANWYPYPYDRAQQVAGPVRGMEYPQIAFASSDARGRGLFALTDHELAHTYFPMLVGSDERRYAWLDEGLVSFMGTYARAAFYNQPIARQLQAQAEAVARHAEAASPGAPTVMTRADNIPRSDFGFLAYQKPAAALHVLREHVLGPDRFDAAFRAYIDRWAYKHPTPYDFFRTIEDVTGEDLAYFWRSWFFAHDTLDQELVSVDTSGERPSIVVRQNEDMILPMTLRLTFEDGDTGTVQVPADAFKSTRMHTVRLGPTQLPIAVEIDPDRILPDTDRSHHEWRAP